MKLMNILLAVLLSVMVFALPAFADDEITNTGTLLVPTVDGETDVTVPDVSVTGPNEPGVLMTADNQSVSATIDGNVDAVYGGVDMESIGSGQATLKAGGIRGGFGVLAYIDGGQITGNVDSITASGDTALEAILSRSGSLQFTANTISSDVDAVTLETGADFSEHIIDPGIYDDPGDPGDDDRDIIDDEEFDESEVSGESDPDGKNLPENFSANNSDTSWNDFLSDPLAVKADGDAGNVLITSGSIDAGRTAVDILLHDDRTVTLTADDITSEGTAVQIAMSEEGGDVTLTAPFIDANEQGIRIDALNGKATVNNNDYLSGKSGVEVFNDGADISLEAGFIYASSGLFVESTSGTTVENTEDIAADNYGIYVRTYEKMTEQPFDPDTELSEQESDGSSDGAPSVKITVDGDIADDFEFPEETGGDYILPPDEYEGKWITKDGEEEAEDEDAEVSTGIIVEADTEGTVEINVLGEVYMAYGNEIDADNGAEVNVSVRDDVITTYGNRLAADDAKVTFSVGNSINAGGNALDTLASGDGEMNVTIGKDILVNDSGNTEETTGIYANSMENGSTRIEVRGGVSVVDESGETPAYGVFAENTGGEITITVGGDVTAEGVDSVGAVIINGSDSDFSETENEEEMPRVKTVIEIHGDLTGTTTGLYADWTESTQAEVFVEGTITGDDAGVEISEEVPPEYLDLLDLKVWKIDLKSGKAVAGGTNAEEVEDHINYLIKYASEDLKRRLEAVDENGELLPSVHDYQYAEDGAKIYFRAPGGDIPVIFNGRNVLPKEEDGRFSLIVPTGGGILISTGPAPVPPAPVDPVRPSDDLFWLFGRELPGTGFSSRHVTQLAARPQELSYRKTGLTLQIPGLDIDEEIVKVPETDGSYHIEWLDSSIGLLEHSSLPGKGITVLTGHNHLNSTEAGPFLFIGEMVEGDRIMITDARNNSSIFKVYGNYKIASNGFESLADELRENALVMITCEDESAEGGYINRRVVLAEPLG